MGFRVAAVKAISLWQPWASYIAAGMKGYETRSWATPYRGPLAIHAAKRPMTEGELELLDEYPLTLPLPFGAIVATCTLLDCVRMTDVVIANRFERDLALGDWYPGRYAWRLVDVVPLAEPMPFRGAQGLFDTEASALGAWVSGWRK